LRSDVQEKVKEAAKLPGSWPHPRHPRCGLASPDASKNLGMAMRTSPKGEGEQRVGFETIATVLNFLRFGHLVIGTWNLFGIWCLGFGI